MWCVVTFEATSVRLACYGSLRAVFGVCWLRAQVRENVPGPGSVTGSAANRAAQLVVDAAIARGSTDNVTCIVVFF